MGGKEEQRAGGETGECEGHERKIDKESQREEGKERRRQGMWSTGKGERM